MPDRLKSADGQRVELLGRSKSSVYIMFPPLQVCFVSKPVIVKRLFTPMMLSTKFLRRYNVSIDAKDNNMHIGIRRNDTERAKVQLHSNKISGVIKVLNYLDDKRRAQLKENAGKDGCSGSLEPRENLEEELKYKDADLRNIAVSQKELGALKAASKRDAFTAYGKAKIKVGSDKFGCPPPALTCGVCRKLAKKAVRTGCCRRVCCEKCVSDYTRENRRCWNYDCKGGDSGRWMVLEEVRRKVKELEKIENGETKGVLKILCSIPGLDKTV